MGLFIKGDAITGTMDYFSRCICYLKKCRYTALGTTLWKTGSPDSFYWLLRAHQALCKLFFRLESNQTSTRTWFFFLPWFWFSRISGNLLSDFGVHAYPFSRGDYQMEKLNLTYISTKENGLLLVTSRIFVHPTDSNSNERSNPKLDQLETRAAWPLLQPTAEEWLLNFEWRLFVKVPLPRFVLQTRFL